MLSKKYLPSLGFVILLTTILGSSFFVKWALEPLGYEKAIIEEQKGHQLAAAGNLKEACKYFLSAAKTEDDKISTSIRYRCAVSTSKIQTDKINYFRLALKYNPNNETAKKELRRYLQEYKYINRYDDGWSKGKKGTIELNVIEKSQNYILKYFTSNPYKELAEIKLIIDGKLINDNKIITHKAYIEHLNFKQGKHVIEFVINKTFNPMKLKMSTDNRNLGINYSIMKKEVKSE